jgi:hypothetical protein
VNSKYIKDEINDYLHSTTNCPIDVDILQWWSANSARFPSISALARSVLAIQATSALSEHAFSISGYVRQVKRNRLNLFKAKKLLYVHDNYELCKGFL